MDDLWFYINYMHLLVYVDDLGGQFSGNVEAATEDMNLM
jgi:hypothetical protein